MLIERHYVPVRIDAQTAAESNLTGIRYAEDGLFCLITGGTRIQKV